ncbi:LRR receptor-like serine/threonine-protein kinase ERL1 [Pyrus ussuriensis x Pyrus communis]|uniref:LRR receptor-like serine/threonine-protein kinase ERL1 n=1 Tax=Pyrus ussuriensis x Pyrus communis TaxID=2448454 RepID=A0A5N5GB73_9ROSA|nr:LRR receptor-like serine/threonine-protein kinase ERL1 [Pyrus ussuriensis x Pyrus communis]
MEKKVLWRKKTKLIFCFGLALMAVLFPPGSPLNDEGKALMSIKASFNNMCCSTGMMPMTAISVLGMGFSATMSASLWPS